jgi:hypothetical protein
MSKSRLLRPLLALVALIGLSAAQAAAAPNLLPRIGIIPFDASGNMTNLASVASSLSDFISIDFKISGRVAVIAIKRPAAEDFTSSVESIMADNKLDYLLFGTVRGNADSDIDIVAYLVDGQGARLSAGYRKLGSLFELTDAGDALYVSLAKNVGTIHRGFGSIELAHEGEGGYDVYLNGELVGHNIDSAENLLNGKYFLEIKQSRPFSTLTLISESMMIGEGERAKVRFKMPAVLPEELAKVTDKFTEIDQNWDKAEEQSTVEQDISGLETSFTDISAAPGVGEFATKTRQYRGLWEVKKMRYAIEDGMLGFDPSRLRELKGLYLSAQTYSDPETIRAGIREEVVIAGSLQSAKAVLAADSGSWASAVRIYLDLKDIYQIFDLPFPAVYSSDLDFFAALDANYASATLKKDGRKPPYGGMIAGGIGLAGASAVLMATDVSSKIGDVSSAGIVGNIIKNIGKDAIVGFENVGFVAGLGLIAAGNAGNYREASTTSEDAKAAARAHFGARVDDAKALSAALGSSSVGKANLLVVAPSPGALAKVTKAGTRRTPFVVDNAVAGDRVVVDTGREKTEIAIGTRIKIAVVNAQPNVVAGQGIKIGEGPEGDYLRSPIDVSWSKQDGAAAYRVIFFSKVKDDPAKSSIQILGPMTDTKVRCNADIPGRELSFAVYALDKDGYPSPIGGAAWTTLDRRDYLADASRLFYMGGAIGGALSTANSAYPQILRAEPAAFCALVPGSFLFGAECQLDIAGSSLQSWKVCPLFVSGDINHGAFDIYKIGLVNEGSSYCASFGFGEGLGRFYFLPTVEVGYSGTLGFRSVSLAIGGIF